MPDRLSAMADWSEAHSLRFDQIIVPNASESAAHEADAADVPDFELLQIYQRFCSAHAELDRLLAREEDPPDEEGLACHREWQDALHHGLSLPAVTDAGKRAKAAMLLAAIGVILGTDERDFLPPELIST